MKEAVFFIFVKDDQILIERRLEESEEPNKVFLPCGGVNDQDHEGSDDYRVTAMKREIREELGENIKLLEYEFLTIAESAEPLRMFHGYLIRKWEGELPEFGLEEGKKNAKLMWVPLDEAFLMLDSDVARLVVGKAITVLREEATIRSYASMKSQ